MDKSIAIIVKQGSKWCVKSEDGSKNLGCFSSREKAVDRIRQVEYFKRAKK